ncbi:MAG: hypothetical protein LBI29_03145 [Rickettsiales bacterium]|jgi:hypothetical protein|nr:hypothetical protein [Rickettsiales bacterium]
MPYVFWQEDVIRSDDPDYADGANEMSLKEERENFRKYSVINLEFKSMSRSREMMRFSWKREKMFPIASGYILSQERKILENPRHNTER